MINNIAKNITVLTKKKTGQAVIEFSLILAAILAAIVLMNNYFKRSLNARLERTALGLNAVFKEINQ